MAKSDRISENKIKASTVVKAGIASAIVGGILLYGPQGKENRKKIKTWAIKAKADVVDEVEKMKDVSEDKYHRAVDRVIGKYGRLKNVSESETVKLGRELKRHWRTVVEEVARKKK